MNTSRFFATLSALFFFVASASATPPAEHFRSWKNSVLASIVYPAGHSVNEDGSFEVELFLEARLDIDQLSMGLDHDEFVVLDGEAPSYSAPLKAGEQKFWRVTGKVNAPSMADADEDRMPPSLLFYVEYLFPAAAVRAEIEKTNFPSRETKNAAFTEAESERGKTVRLLRPLPLVRHEPDLSAYAEDPRHGGG